MMDVIIVDDEQAGRRTLREYCEAEGDLRVVGEFGDGSAALILDVAQLIATGQSMAEKSLAKEAA